MRQIVMLVVISDLHFQDTVNDAVRDSSGNVIAEIERNVSPEAFRKVFHQLLTLAESNRAQELLIVLAGDIFDLNRSQVWFDTNYDKIRPYGEHEPAQWGPIADKIFDHIVESNRETINIFKKQAETMLNNGKRVMFQYIPGNHDRIINLYPPLRKKVRDLFGLGGGSDPFAHVISAVDYGVYIRHGHEYDSSNFAGKTPETGPFRVDIRDYDIAPIGDYVTIDIAARLAFEYRKRHERDMKAGPDAELHRSTYRRLLEFDDLRPQSQILPFIEAETVNGGKVKEFLDPVLKELLTMALNSEFLRNSIGAFKISLARIAKFISTEFLINSLVRSAAGSAPCQTAQREPALQDPKFRYIVAGHTHNPNVEFLARRHDGKETFFFDTGTWRQQVRRCCDHSTFSKAKALTYVAFYASNEDPSRKGGGKEYSFDYWSGYTKKELV